MTEPLTESLRARFARALFRPVDIAWLAVFRILFGATMCVSTVRFIAFGWVDDLFVKPAFHFKYYGLGWLPELSPSGVHALFWALSVAAIFIAAGFCFRLAAFFFLFGFLYLQLLDVATYLNHYYLAALLSLLLALSPAHRAWSLDALLRPRLAATSVTAFWHCLFRFQVGVVYSFAGLAKFGSDWLLHAQPLRLWLAARTDMPVLGPLFAYEETALFMSWAGFLFDTTIAWWLLSSRTRPHAYAVVIFFHAVTNALFPIGMFPVIMVLSALVFFSPSWPRRLLARLARREAAVPMVAAPVASAPGRWQRLGVAVAAIYCVLQVTWPLRFLAYGDNLLWHEQGMRFAWRVMVREKNGSVTFIVENERTGRTWHVAPRSYLTALQEREMGTQPDLILQLAKHIRGDFELRGKGPVRVRVNAVASLNGRRSARLIDPSVDLASTPDGLGKAAWILPAPSGPPPRIRPIAPSRERSVAAL